MQQIGRYQVIERLGRGAMGVVYKALDPRIGRTIAIKSIRLAEISDASELKRLRDRLEREARSAGALSHRNIVAIYDILEEEKLVHLFMEYVNGPSLEKLLNDGVLPERANLLKFFQQIASALDYAHKIGIVHRDVKPSNLLVHFERATEEQVAKITDFGVAKFISQQMTQAGSMMGTPNYMAPEQIEGAPITGQADQFALAAVAYEVLCGEKPFVADYIPTLFFRIVREDPRAANQVNATLSPAVNLALQRGLAKKPENRFESCTAFVDALCDALEAQPEWMPPYKVGTLVIPPPETEAEHGFAMPAHGTPGTPSPETRYEPPPPSQPPPPPPQQPIAPPEFFFGAQNEETVAQSHTQPPPVGSTTEEIQLPEPKPQGPVILPYDLPYRLPELRRGRKEEEEEEGLPLWRKVAIVILIIAMAAIGYAVYRNFTGSQTTASGQSNPIPPPDTSAATTAPDGGLPGAKSPSTVTPPSSPSPQPSGPQATNSAPPPETEKKEASANSRPADASANTAHQPAKPSNAPPEETSEQHNVPAVPVPVQFSSDPAAARVVVDRNESKSCSTPCSIPLMPGRHTLTVAAANYGLAQRIIEVPDQRDVFVPLSQNVAIVQLDTVPSGSTLYVDGKLEGQTPSTLKLRPGPHQIRLVSGNRSLQQTIQVSAETLQSFVFRWQ
ncbi:MAG TPA: protein kinase [Bryobacteraceae bacterium]|nr:protein kinase [Bryobacteraceae bacterium]